MDRIGFHGFIVHLEIPDFQIEKISGEHVSARMTKFDVTDRRDDLGEETSCTRVLWLLEN